MLIGLALAVQGIPARRADNRGALAVSPALHFGPWTPEAAHEEAADEGTEDVRSLVLPTGRPPSLTCEQARKIVAQARAMIASPPSPIDAPRFASATSDWLDPHGLWSVAPDAPVAQALSSHAGDLVDELEADPQTGACVFAGDIGTTLATWVGSLRKTTLEAERLARSTRPLPSGPKARWDVVSATPFEDGTVERRAHDLARLIGHGAGSMEGIYGDELAPYARAVIDRTVPELDAREWSEVLLAAEVRAYLPQLDPHGAWAPIDEETSIYDMSLEVDPPDHLWSDMTRTTAGVRVDRGALPPLRDGDVVLEVAGVELAGLSVEQVNQLSVVESGVTPHVVVLRSSSPHPIALDITGERDGSSREAAAPPALEVKRVPYGDGFVASIAINEVPDDLGDRLGAAVRDAKQPTRLSTPRPRSRAAVDDTRSLVGVVLDLRGNGGGSTDGAISALGLFLPGAPMFPMKRRDGAVEIDRAPTPTDDERWNGPLGVLVDGETASAAEMIAGALVSYHRAVLVGSHTYGKGCAQEYIDDDAQRGVMRLTTLVFSLPDGSALQRVGLDPQIALGMGAGAEREAFLPHSLAPWTGPDVRERSLVRDVAWPANAGRVGPCNDETLCRALRSLGSYAAATR